MDQFKDKTAIVTGASSGMGEAIARALAAEGAVVALAARRKDRLDAIVAEIAAAGGTAFAVPTDVTVEAQVEALFKTVIDRQGRLDLVVASAGVPQATPIEQMSLAEWHAVMDANLTSCFLAGREALKIMKPQGRGRPPSR